MNLLALTAMQVYTDLLANICDPKVMYCVYHLVLKSVASYIICISKVGSLESLAHDHNVQ